MLPRLSRHILLPSSPISSSTSWTDKSSSSLNIRSCFNDSKRALKKIADEQAEVLKWEKQLNETRTAKQEHLLELRAVQKRLSDIHSQMDSTSRGEERNLHLLAEEHRLIRREQQLGALFMKFDEAERTAFNGLSSSVHTNQEKERQRAGENKWIRASAIGAAIGIAATSIGSELKKRKEPLSFAVEEIERIEEKALPPVVVFKAVPPPIPPPPPPTPPTTVTPMATPNKPWKDITCLIEDQNKKIGIFLSEMEASLKLNPKVKRRDIQKLTSVDDFDKAVEVIKAENDRLLKEMAELSRLVKIEASIESQPVVYVSNEKERLLDEAERNMESKMKLKTLLAVVFAYTAIGVTVPLLYAVFKGN